MIIEMGNLIVIPEGEFYSYVKRKKIWLPGFEIAVTLLREEGKTAVGKLRLITLRELDKSGLRPPTAVMWEKFYKFYILKNLYIKDTPLIRNKLELLKEATDKGYMDLSGKFPKEVLSSSLEGVGYRLCKVSKRNIRFMGYNRHWSSV